MDENEKVTIDHEEIKRWAEKYGGKPAMIDDVEAGSDEIGLRINFPGEYDEKYLDLEDTRSISWEEFFRIFEEKQLGFIYEEETKKDKSWAYKFIKRENLNGEELMED